MNQQAKITDRGSLSVIKEKKRVEAEAVNRLASAVEALRIVNKWEEQLKLSLKDKGLPNDYRQFNG